MLQSHFNKSFPSSPIPLPLCAFRPFISFSRNELNLSSYNISTALLLIIWPAFLSIILTYCNILASKLCCTINNLFSISFIFIYTAKSLFLTLFINSFFFQEEEIVLLFILLIHILSLLLHLILLELSRAICCDSFLFFDNLCELITSFTLILSFLCFIVNLSSSNNFFLLSAKYCSCSCLLHSHISFPYFIFLTESSAISLFLLFWMIE